MSEKKVITLEDALKCIPEGENVHTFRSGGMMMMGCDWQHESIVDALTKAPEIQVSGEFASGMGHGIAINHNGWLFIETVKTDEAKGILA